jgi:DNA-binding transcriptional LysR family regulator
MLDFRTLETFLWVATLGSFRGAAARLNTTQPAVSQRIAQLEDTLGVRLIERERRASVPTEKGRELMVYAERLLRIRAEMIAAVGDRRAMGGLIRLGVPETIVHTWLPRFVERLNAAHPRISLEIEVDISPNLRDRLVAKEIDLAILLGPIGAPSVRSLPLCSYESGFVASPALDLPHDRPAKLAELARHPVITFARNTQPHGVVRELFARADLPVRMHASASLATVVRMALDGIGVAAIPPAIVAREIAEGRLRRLACEAVLPDLNFLVCWPESPDTTTAETVAALAREVAGESLRPIA